MVRQYVKVVGPTRRCNYNNANLEKAVEAVKSGGYSIRQAALKFQLPNSTVRSKVRGLHRGKLGHPTALTEEEEKKLVACIITCANWRYPLKDIDLRLAVKGYLDRQGRVIKSFMNNFPGQEWVMGFLTRNPEIRDRLAQNLKRARATLSKEIITEYFNHLSKSLEGVDPKCIVNYDETNFTDDPGSVKVLARKGVRRVERVIDHTKTSVSVMLAGAADGTMLPPYVVYQSKHLYDTWTEGGPDGCRYNRTSSGWFDQVSFEDWFQTIILPYFRHFNGPKVLIGDNLSSHLSQYVTNLCFENDIRFVFLPKNSTHLCQPLDVSFFAPLKKEWRKILNQWKTCNKGTITKAAFPALLKGALDGVGTKVATNLISGFRATGIYPLNPEAVLKHFPSEVIDEDIDLPLTQSIIDQVKEIAGAVNPAPLARKTRLSVPAGKSVMPADFFEDEGGDLLEEEEVSEEPTASSSLSKSSQSRDDLEAMENLDTGDYVLVEFDVGKTIRKFTGVISGMRGDKISVNFMRKKVGKKLTTFQFPNVVDEQEVNREMIIKKLKGNLVRRGGVVFDSLRELDDVE